MIRVLPQNQADVCFQFHKAYVEEHGGSVVECLTQDRVVGLSLTVGIVLCL